MLRQRLRDQFESTPRVSRVVRPQTGPTLSEYKLSIIGLFVSLTVIGIKLYYSNRETIKNFLVEERLISYEVITENGDLMYKYAWKSAVKYSGLWFPALCGGLTTYFTWLMVYLDSHVPGIQPPSPFSPTKYKAASGHTFHLNYVFAVMIGLMVAIYMYWKKISLQY